MCWPAAPAAKRPDLVVCVLDATNLRRNLRLVLAVQRLGLPMVVALNMADLAARRGLQIDTEALGRALGVPVVRTVATQGEGLDALRALLDRAELWDTPAPAELSADGAQDQARVSAILQQLGLDRDTPELPSDRLDRVLLHPLLGPLLLALLLFGLFQAVYSWAEAPKGWIEAAAAGWASWRAAPCRARPWTAGRAACWWTG